MNARKLARRLQWYQIIGRSTNHSPTAVAFVEATSRQKALRAHSLRYKLSTGKDLWGQFPKERVDVKYVGRSLDNELLYAMPGTLVEVLPITRYQCSCGKEHVTETPLPGVWCSCGKRALPVAENRSTVKSTGQTNRSRKEY